MYLGTSNGAKELQLLHYKPLGNLWEESKRYLKQTIGKNRYRTCQETSQVGGTSIFSTRYQRLNIMRPSN